MGMIASGPSSSDMAAIRTLLNPVPEAAATAVAAEKSEDSDTHAKDREPTRRYDCLPPLPAPVRKKTKLCKDAPVFFPGNITGVCRYPPDEYQDASLAEHHQRHKVYPMGKIAEYPRRIPYNSGKKSLLQQIGRNVLNVFQYTFVVPGDDTEYAMLWDYNVGLVRTTPLFKCTGHAKTTPAKMLNRNPGLREICYGITGGALVAQGYWIPYEAAKAIAATFCWNIRYALTPVFGVKFPSLCFDPNHSRYGEMTIDPSIIEGCTEETRMYRDLYLQPASRSSTATPIPLTPDTPTHPSSVEVSCGKMLPPIFSTPTSDGSAEAETKARGNASPSCTSSSSCGQSQWSPVNTPRSLPRSISPTKIPSQDQQGMSSSEGPSFKFDHITDAQGEVEDEKACEGDASSDNNNEDDNDNEEGGGVDDNQESDNKKNKKKQQQQKTKLIQTETAFPSDERAAFLLMSLRMQDANRAGPDAAAALAGRKRNRKRTASV